MKSILEEFAYGNISPEAQCFERNSAYGRAVKTLSDTEEKLLKRLGAEEKSLFEQFSSVQGDLNQLTAVSNLVYGYKLGLLMTAEAFFTSGGLIAGEGER